MAENKGTGYPDNPVRHKDSPLPFTVREATELEEAEIKRRREIDGKTDDFKVRDEKP
jgi:hypothetical protein